MTSRRPSAPWRQARCPPGCSEQDHRLTAPPCTSCAMACTASQSPFDAAGNPASMTSTPSSAKAWAMRSFSGLSHAAAGRLLAVAQRGIEDHPPGRVGGRDRSERDGHSSSSVSGLSALKQSPFADQLRAVFRSRGDVSLIPARCVKRVSQHNQVSRIHTALQLSLYQHSAAPREFTTGTCLRALQTARARFPCHKPVNGTMAVFHPPCALARFPCGDNQPLTIRALVNTSSVCSLETR